MSQSFSGPGRLFVAMALGMALVLGVLVSPFASQDPDGLDRVAKDHNFAQRATPPVAQKLPFYTVFDAYALRGAPPSLATPLAGLIGVLTTFGVAWGVGKLTVRNAAVGADAVVPPTADPRERG